MRVLIIEDNQTKLQTVRKYLKQNYSDMDIHDAISFTAGLRRIYDSDWDLILLDMTLPVYDINQLDSGGEKKPTAGKEIMKRMQHRKKIIPVIVITQFDTFGDNNVTIDTLNAEFTESMSDIWRGTVSYDKSSWQTELKKLIDKISGEQNDKNTCS